MPILIRDEYFEKKAEAEKSRRKHKSLAKTVLELASERLSEISAGTFLPPTEMDQPKRRRQHAAA